ncbi:MAG: AAA family ATPase [Nitrospiraceae bacterium]|nr:MAG: AAA family ATPase [Nitrospiraceae bacterium]
MYNEYFGFKESPFSIAPDPRYLYMSEQHREALAHLLYGFNSHGGFVLLTGEVGTGKTTVCRCLLDQIPEKTAIAFIINSKLTVEELLATICDEFRITYPAGNSSVKVFVDLINAYLLEAHEQGFKAVLIIDEAQNLSADVLEQLRLLTNLETSQRKLLQVILLGQPELREKLARPELRQLSQRIVARYHLGALSRKEVGAYVRHRLEVAGSRRSLFSDPSMGKLYRLSRGIPRLINVICDRALLGTFATGNDQVTIPTLRKAAREVFGDAPAAAPFSRASLWPAAILVLAVAGLLLAASMYYKTPPAEPQQALDRPEAESPRDRGSEAVLAGTTAASSESEEQEMLKKKGLQWPAAETISGSRTASFQTLFKQWNISYEPEQHGDACAFAGSEGLECYPGSGTMESIIVLDLPAVLTLFNSNGREFHAVLTALRDGRATLVTGRESRDVPLADLASQNPITYLVLWKAPARYRTVIKPGRRDILIPWIDNSLAQIQNRPQKVRSNILYDEELVQQVKLFQRSEGLSPDGIIGPRTMMRITSSVEGSGPTLTGKEKHNGKGQA